MHTRTPATDLALVAVFAALIAAGSWIAIPIPGSTVPFTLQVMMCALAGLVLGPWRGALSVILYIVVGLAGLPVFAGGKSGLGVLAGPTAGYLYGFVLEALVVGALAKLVLSRLKGAALTGALVAASLVGLVLLVHPCGIFGLMINAHMTLAKAVTVDAAFWIGDIVKNVAAALVAVAVHKAFPALLRSRRAVAARA